MNGIWVRSQDKNGPWLIVGTKRFVRDEEHPSVGYGIRGYLICGEIIGLGHYPTETRAIEVQEEIQGFIDWKVINDGSMYCNPSVYNMPQE